MSRWRPPPRLQVSSEPLYFRPCAFTCLCPVGDGAAPRASRDDSHGPEATSRGACSQAAPHCHHLRLAAPPPLLLHSEAEDQMRERCGEGSDGVERPPHRPGAALLRPSLVATRDQDWRRVSSSSKLRLTARRTAALREKTVVIRLSFFTNIFFVKASGEPAKPPVTAGTSEGATRIPPSMLKHGVLSQADGPDEKWLQLQQDGFRATTEFKENERHTGCVRGAQGTSAQNRGEPEGHGCFASHSDEILSFVGAAPGVGI